MIMLVNQEILNERNIFLDYTGICTHCKQVFFDGDNIPLHRFSNDPGWVQNQFVRSESFRKPNVNNQTFTISNRKFVDL